VLSGKTTVARLVAERRGMSRYHLDRHHWNDHATRLDPLRHPAALEERRLTFDEIWLSPGGEAAARSLASWRQTFELVVEDLLKLPHEVPIVAEGPGALPSLVWPLLSHRLQGMWLIADGSLYDLTSRRLEDFRRRSTDPERALVAKRRHDAEIARVAEAEAVQLGLPYLRVTSEIAAALVADQVAEQFASLESAPAEPTLG